MGEEGIVRARTLVAYFELYDFTNLNILAALRMTCGRLGSEGGESASRSNIGRLLRNDGANATPIMVSR